MGADTGSGTSGMGVDEGARTKLFFDSWPAS